MADINTDKECREELTFRKKIFEIKKHIKETLIEKNKLYGDSALSPQRIISKLGPSEGIAIRMDDKLNRILNSPIDPKTEKRSFRKNDVFDLMGYCILYTISCMRASQNDREKRSFKSEVDRAAEFLSDASFTLPNPLYDLMYDVKCGNDVDEEDFFVCLELDIVNVQKNGEVDLIDTVQSLFTLCIFVALYRNFMDFEDQID